MLGLPGPRRDPRDQRRRQGDRGRPLVHPRPDARGGRGRLPGAARRRLDQPLPGRALVRRSAPRAAGDLMSRVSPSARWQALRGILAVGHLRRMYAVVGLWAATDLAFFLAVSVVAYGDGGPGAVGLVGAARVLPGALCLGFVAVVADRVSRPLLVAAVNVAFVVISLVMAATVAAGGSLVVLVLLQVAASVAAALLHPSLHGLLPRLVPLPSQLIQAGAVWSLVTGIGAVLGPGIGGWLLARGGPDVLFLALAVVYAVTAGIAGSIRTTYQPAREPSRALASLRVVVVAAARHRALRGARRPHDARAVAGPAGPGRLRRRVPGPLRVRGLRCRRSGPVGHPARRGGRGRPRGLHHHPGGRRSAHPVVVRGRPPPLRAAAGRPRRHHPGGARDARPRGLRRGRRLGPHLRLEPDHPAAPRPRRRPRLGRPARPRRGGHGTGLAGGTPPGPVARPARRVAPHRGARGRRRPGRRPGAAYPGRSHRPATRGRRPAQQCRRARAPARDLHRAPRRGSGALGGRAG